MLDRIDTQMIPQNLSETVNQVVLSLYTVS
jgi:hypothetical protein